MKTEKDCPFHNTKTQSYQGWVKCPFDKHICLDSSLECYYSELEYDREEKIYYKGED